MKTQKKRMGCLFLYILITFLGISTSLYAADRVSIYDIQYTTDPSGDSPYNGQSVTISGIVTAVFFEGFTVSEQSGAWHSIYVFTQNYGPDIGDEVELTGMVSEFYGMTEIQDLTAFEIISTQNPVNPTIIDNQTAKTEAYESVFVRILDVTVTSLESYGEWIINDGTSDLPCDDLNDYMYFPSVGDYLNSVSGIIFYSYSAFKLEPRCTRDIETDLLPHYALKGTIVTMNDTRDIVENGYIEILGDIILDISTTEPAGIQIIDTGELIFPGMIDAHNHPLYNVLDIIPFPCTFADRDEWHDHPMYADFSTQFRAIRDYGGSYNQATNLWKLAEVRELCSGVTMIQGYNCNGHDNDDIAHEGMIINNVERFPSKVFSSTFPLPHHDDWVDTKYYEFWDRFVIHLSEGFSGEALNEFYTWQSWGMLDWRTVIIHGVPYGDTEWIIMANENAHLIWSPMSNWILYETTADVPGALAAGVNVALAPDWTESGQPNMLREMKFAQQINQDLWSGIITPLQFAEFVTRNAAYAMSVDDRAGQLSVNYQADIMVIPGDPSDPYQSLLDTETSDIMLTIVNGRPMYGDPEIMAQFSFVTPQEDISICGQPKKLAIQISAHGIPDSDKSFATVVSELQTAYDASYPKVCDFISYDPCAAGPTPTPTSTPTNPTPTPTGSPEPPTATPTPSDCSNLGVTIWMPSHDFEPGNTCSLEVQICNPYSQSTYHNIPLFVILDVYGYYYFAPSFTEYDYYEISNLHPGITTQTVIPEFTWPEGVGTASGIMVYAGMTNHDITDLWGDYDVFTFGWHE